MIWLATIALGVWGLVLVALVCLWVAHRALVKAGDATAEVVRLRAHVYGVDEEARPLVVRRLDNLSCRVRAIEKLGLRRPNFSIFDN